MSDFEQLGLSASVMQGVRASGYTEPTPIQAQSIPVAIQGKDILGSAQTGTGKTAAFVLPSLSRLAQHQAFPRCLILLPTRELALQVENALKKYGQFTDLTSVVIYGGVGYEAQNEGLRKGPDFIVATPGRLLDHMQEGRLRLNRVEILILDEADRMLDMGFLPDVRRIIESCPRKRQTLLFSATLPPEITSFCNWALHNPERIEINRNITTAETVNHAIYPVSDDQKPELLRELLKRTNFDQVLIFTRTKMNADLVYSMLKRENHSVAVIHADRTQTERTHAMDGFRTGKHSILVATDIASRGLDIANVTHVINYDVPQHPEDYVHRIGRTGRAKSEGDAFTIMVAEDLGHVQDIERYIKQKISKVRLENFPYNYTRAFEATTPLNSRAIRVGSSYFTSGVGRRRRR